MKKIQNRSGETIAEVLVASLVVVLGVLLFATMVSSSFNIIQKSEKKMKEIYAAESNAEIYQESVPPVSAGLTLASGDEGTGAYNGLISAGDLTGMTVSICGDENIKSYKK